MLHLTDCQTNAKTNQKHHLQSQLVNLHQIRSILLVRELKKLLPNPLEVLPNSLVEGVQKRPLSKVTKQHQHVPVLNVVKVLTSNPLLYQRKRKISNPQMQRTKILISKQLAPKGNKQQLHQHRCHHPSAKILLLEVKSLLLHPQKCNVTPILVQKHYI